MGAEPIEHPMVTKAIEKAQKRVEEQNFEIRKHLLEYDDVLNEQRNYIYGQRNDILLAEDLIQRGVDSCRAMVQELVETALAQKETPSKTAVRLKEALVDLFAIMPSIDEKLLEKNDVAALVDSVHAVIEEEIGRKVAITGTKPLNDFLRIQYLKQIDMRWQDHLEQLEALREAVYLRTYAQKNPLLEYKLEGFDIFDTMINEIKRSIARMLVRIRIHTDEQPVQRKPMAVRMVESHQGATQFTAEGPQRTAGAQQGPHPVQVVRTTAKVGRNDPCPCGSGKKYKHCHGS